MDNDSKTKHKTLTRTVGVISSSWFLQMLNPWQIRYGSCTRIRAIGSNFNSGKPGQFSGFDLSLCRDTAQVVVNKITVPWHDFCHQPALFHDRACSRKNLYQDLQKPRHTLLTPWQLSGQRTSPEYSGCPVLAPDASVGAGSGNTTSPYCRAVMHKRKKLRYNLRH